MERETSQLLQFSFSNSNPEFLTFWNAYGTISHFKCYLQIGQDMIIPLLCVHAQLCPTLFDPMDCRLPVSSVYSIFQARILQWVAVSFSRNLPNRGMELGSPAFQEDSSPLAPSAKIHLYHNIPCSFVIITDTS